MSTTVGEPTPLHWRYILRPPPMSTSPPELLASVAATTTTWNVLTKVTTRKKKHARDAILGATVKGSIKDENTIRRETDNAKLLEGMCCLRQMKTSVERFHSLSSRSLNAVF